MNYRVIWRERLTNNVHAATHIAHETGRNARAITRAVAQINRTLGSTPSAVGESRSGDERVLIVDPLSVIYEVFEEARVVMIYAAVLYPRFTL